ncbi:RCC1/BLIP-II [Eremomyces bilateralis CBS 781.70]|uniref:RCC1/BLIP-II n=1 Tax=Eremomyces bilateralis CBS 781.70 TaxID=1392243 RepID=A0A6G1G4D6_9PEZI|nr:RCC1/BLIP-II [Eremomyces bilateralis CBS 781.70]KAF1812923.1 RCC1/BLIP-II [Eremomyces bilateralis CBS 781.70]
MAPKKANAKANGTASKSKTPAANTSAKRKITAAAPPKEPTAARSMRTTGTGSTTTSTSTGSKRVAKPAAKPAAKPTKPKAASKAATETAKKAAPTSGDKLVNGDHPKPKNGAKADAPMTNGTTKKGKRKADGDTEAPPAKKVKETKAPAEKAAAKPIKKAKAPATLPVINQAPTDRLNVFVFGEGSAGELGLGTAKNAIDVKRPRLNPLLPADQIGIVLVASGGMHNVALTHDNRILTWGVNDQGALGRDTAWEGGLRDIDAEDSDSDDEDSGLNPRESTPTAVSAKHFPEGTNFVQVAAGDSVSFALTDNGQVYGWGTFRSNEGVMGFGFSEPGHKLVMVQETPVLIPNLKNIVQIACGANHALALDNKGKVSAWGCGQTDQLGYRTVERRRLESLVPREVGMYRRKIRYVTAGSYHSFAIDQNDDVWGWGLNSFGEAGDPETAGGDSAMLPRPKKIEGLSGKGVTHLSGGNHHSAAVAANGDCLIWGRMDGGQIGIDFQAATLEDEEMIRKNESGKPKILLQPMALPNLRAKQVCCGPDHTLVVTTEGKAYSTGFNANYQLGIGNDDDVTTMTLIDNTAVRERSLNWAGAGGQFSVLTAVADEPQVNGH